MPELLDNAQEIAQRRIGPLPAWGWAVVGVGGVAAVLVIRRIQGGGGGGASATGETFTTSGSGARSTGGPSAGGIAGEGNDFLPGFGSDIEGSQPLTVLPNPGLFTAFFDTFAGQLGGILEQLQGQVQQTAPEAAPRFAPGVDPTSPDVLVGDFEAPELEARRGILPTLQRLAIGGTIKDTTTGKVFTQQGTKAGALSALSAEEFQLVPDFVKRAVTVGSSLTTAGGGPISERGAAELETLHRATLPAPSAPPKAA